LKLIKEPSVYLTTRTAVNWEAIAEFLAAEGVPPIPDSIRAGDDESAAVVEVSARMCYMSYGRGRRDIAEFVTNLLSSKDGSVFEHVNYGFVVTGVSRSLTHELVRHRAGFAYSQRSQRYVDEAGAAFVVPPALAREVGDVEKAAAVFEKAIEVASSSYDELVAALEKTLPLDLFELKTDRRKAIRQAARSVLPNATETKIFITANVRAWRHFIEMRGASYADWEIRSLALRILALLEEESPLLFGDFTVEQLPDGTSIATPLYSKV
jgi:thymidylate synthase (FAD)